MQWNKLGYDIIWYEKNSSSCSPQMCQFRSVILRESGRVGSGQVRSRCLQSYHTRNVLVGKLFAKINTSEVSSTRFPKISWTESLKSFLRHVTFHALPLYTETTKVTVVFSRCLVLLWQSHWIPTSRGYRRRGGGFETHPHTNFNRPKVVYLDRTCVRNL